MSCADSQWDHESWEQTFSWQRVGGREGERERAMAREEEEPCLKVVFDLQTMNEQKQLLPGLSDSWPVLDYWCLAWTHFQTHEPVSLRFPWYIAGSGVLLILNHWFKGSEQIKKLQHHVKFFILSTVSCFTFGFDMFRMTMFVVHSSKSKMCGFYFENPWTAV